MGSSVIEHEVAADPVLQVVDLPVEAVIQHEVVVRPLEPGADAGGEAVHLHDLVIGEESDGQIGVGLPRVVGLEIQRGRFLSEEPRLGESEHEGRVVGSVGLETQGQVLRVAERNRPPGVLVKETLGGEVVEVHTDGGHECVGSPTSGKFQLAGRLLRHVVDKIHRVVQLVRDD